MRVNDWLKFSERLLKKSGVATSRLDSLVMLEHVTGRDRAWLLANPEFIISAAITNRLKNLLKRRSNHEPISYIMGKTEFYGREFVLTKGVLEPRPESETMIDLLKAITKSHHKSHKSLHIADVGTGSGALGITAKLELPFASVDLIDIDKKALKVAKFNVDLFTLNLSIIESDLLLSTKSAYDILLCNLPYVPDSFKINSAAQHEPKIAIFGGKDGLNVYRHLFSQLQIQHKKPLYILSESLPSQHSVLEDIAKTASYNLVNSDDFIQIFKRA